MRSLLNASRVERIPDRVAEHDEGEHGEHQEQGGEQQHVRGLPDQPDAGGLRRWTEPRKWAGGWSPMPRKEGSFGGDEGAQIDRGDHDDRGQRVRQDVRQDDPASAGPQGARGLHVVVRFHLQHAGPHQPGEVAASRRSPTQSPPSPPRRDRASRDCWGRCRAPGSHPAAAGWRRRCHRSGTARASTQPPKNPATMPIAEPNTNVKRVAKSPTRIEDRAP